MTICLNQQSINSIRVPLISPHKIKFRYTQTFREYSRRTVTATIPKQSKPPAMSVNNTNNFPQFIKSLRELLRASEFECKTNDDAIRCSTDGYRKTIHSLRSGNVDFRIVQPKEEKPFRVVIHNRVGL